MQYYHYQITDQLEEKEQNKMDVFLSIFFHRQSLYRFNYSKDYNGVYFSSREIQAIFGRHKYQDAVEIVEALGIKRQDRTNKFGNRLYYFAPHNELLEYDPVDSIPSIITRNLRKLHKHKKQSLSDEARVVLNNLKQLKFNCTRDDYLELMKSGYPSYVLKKATIGKEPLELEGYLKQALEYWSRIGDFRRARGYDYLDYIWEDTFGNRLHSIMTCCPCILKRSGYVHLSGQPIACLDLHQSQPNILAKTLQVAIGINSFTATLNVSDDIYIEMQKRLELPDRDSAKQDLYKMIFGNPKDKASKVFYKMFPDAGAWINRLKSVWKDDNPSIKKHSNLAFLMQRMETEIFRGIWKKLAEEGIPFLSVHDEIIVPDKFISEAEMIMLAILKISGLPKHNISVESYV